MPDPVQTAAPGGGSANEPTNAATAAPDAAAQAAAAEAAKGATGAAAKVETPPADPAAKVDDPTAKPEDVKTETQVPETYDLKMPAGVELDTAAAAEFSVIAKELKLDAPTAQKFADIAAKMQSRQMEAHAKTVKGWVESSRADAEFGGDAFDKNIGLAKQARETFGTPEFNTFLDTTGLGNHPDMLRMLWKVGKGISESKFHPAGARAATPEANAAQRLYPNMNP